MADHVDFVLKQWGDQRPDLDVSAMAVIGRLSRLGQVVSAELRRTFAVHGLDPASFDVLATMRRSDPRRRLTPTELKQACMVTSGAISQRLDRLEARGMVVRSSSVADGRTVHVVLTPRGRAVIDDALLDHVATLDRLLHGLKVGDRQQLAGLLRALLLSLGDSLDDGPSSPCRGGTPSWRPV